jgi:hypothetical protein
MPTKTRIQIIQDFLAPGFHRGDGIGNLAPRLFDTL